jgi:hypothetical protein
MGAQIGAEGRQVVGGRRHARELAEMRRLGPGVEIEHRLALKLALAAIERDTDPPRLGLDPALDATADPTRAERRGHALELDQAQHRLRPIIADTRHRNASTAVPRPFA